MPNRDVLVLAAGQALTSTVVSLLTSVSSLSGAYLAPSPALSTVPVTASVLGTLVMIYPAAALMGRLGRRGGFMFKAGIGILGGAVCALALVAASFSLLIAGTFLLGLFSAFGQYYRFAAIDAARSPQDRTSAVAIVTGGGVVGGIAGPFLGGHFASVAAVPYVGAFVALSRRLRRSGSVAGSALRRSRPRFRWRYRACRVASLHAQRRVSEGHGDLRHWFRGDDADHECGPAVAADVRLLAAGFVDGASGTFRADVSAVAVQSGAGARDRVARTGDAGGCGERPRLRTHGTDRTNTAVLHN